MNRRNLDFGPPDRLADSDWQFDVDVIAAALEERMWPHAERVTIERTGHIGLITRPDAFAGAVVSFVERNADIRPEARSIRLKPDATSIRLKPDSTEARSIRLKPDSTGEKRVG